ncbi:MAG: DUF4352 domain-containing protein [Clostridia bacterium]|nr:DUF4352 domain-containing protein [Clostridia bacterium]
MKYCTNCGKPIEDTAKFCPNCGNIISDGETKQNNPNSTGSQPVQPTVIIQQEAKAQKKKQAGLGIAAFICSLTVVLAPLAVIFSIIALITAKGKKKGLAIAGLIIGGIITFIAASTIIRNNKSGNSSTSIGNTSGYVSQYNDSSSKNDISSQKNTNDKSSSNSASEKNSKSNNQSTTTQAPAATKEPAATAIPEKDVYQVGDVINSNNIKIIYVASGIYNETNRFSQPKDGYQYIFLKFAFINEGKSDFTVSYISFDAYADGYACDVHYDLDKTISATLSAGRSTEGIVIYEVPVDAKDIEVEYEANIFTSSKIRFAYEGDKDSGYVLDVNTSRKADAYNVGAVIKGNGLTISYISCEPYTSDNMFVQPKEGYHYYTLTLEFENTGNSDKFISVYSFECYADGLACDQTYIRDDALSATISSGKKAKGTVTFEIPDNAEIVEVEYEDNIWTSGKITLTVR